MSGQKTPTPHHCPREGTDRNSGSTARPNSGSTRCLERIAGVLPQVGSRLSRPTSRRIANHLLLSACGGDARDPRRPLCRTQPCFSSASDHKSKLKSQTTRVQAKACTVDLKRDSQDNRFASASSDSRAPDLCSNQHMV